MSSYQIDVVFLKGFPSALGEHKHRKMNVIEVTCEKEQFGCRCAQMLGTHDDRNRSR